MDGGDKAEFILQNKEGILNLERSGNEFHMESNLGFPELSALVGELVQNGVRVLFFQEQEGTLEDVFLHVTKGGI
jgi:hypothetical protein